MQKSWDDITPLLEAKLTPSVIKTRVLAGMNLSYVEAWRCIAEANRIFGYGCWNRETVYCKEVSRTQNADKNKVGYEAKVRITVGDVVREGTGHGSQVSRDLFDAVEGAAKEAESDAMKRALMTFGNPFGLALYDKKQEGVEKDAPKPDPKKETTKVELSEEEKKENAFNWVNAYIVKVRDAKDIKELTGIETESSDRRERMRASYPDYYAMMIDEENNKARKLS
jgi:DNA repair and recombination protein RAD52